MSLHTVKLTKHRDASGKVIPGLWVSDIVRFERVDHQLWQCQVPLRKIGSSNYFEFRPVAMGGAWMTIGCYRKRDGGCIAAEFLQAGTHVLRGGYIVGGEQMPRTLIEWSAEVSAEIARQK